MHKDLILLLYRTNLSMPFNEFLQNVAASYPKIGNIISFQPIIEGYEDANILLLTTTGKFVIKIFFKGRSKGNVESYIRIVEEAQKIGVPVAKLVAGVNGNLSYASKDKTPYYLTDFFDGKDFKNVTPTIEDMLQVTKYLAKLNTLTFPVVDCYDSWGNKNLIAEYEKNKEKLSPAQNETLVPIVEDVRRLDFSKFSVSIIHGDMQRKHILKDAKGKYCLLDFGCAANGPKVIELSTFLAWFCLGLFDNWVNRREIVSRVLAQYASVHHLTKYELAALPVLTYASYAAYYLKTCQLRREGDKSRETLEWYAESGRMVALSRLAGRGKF